MPTAATKSRPPRSIAATEPPSPFRIQRAMTALAQARDQLLALDPDMASDETLWADMLEGETQGDPMAVIDRLARAAIDADYLADATAEHVKALSERRQRYTRRKEVCRRIVQAMLSELDLKKIERADFTARIQTPLKGGIHITDEKGVPDAYCEITRTPKRSLIGDALDRGETVVGAVRGNPEPFLVVTVR
jgi:hypothetical protein